MAKRSARIRSTGLSPPAGFQEDRDDHARNAREIFTRGFLVNITNPKGIIFFAAFLPQLVDVARPQLAQYVIMGATTFVTDLAIMMGYTALAAKVFRAMSEPAHLRWVNRGLGSLFVTAGVALASWRRAASTVIPA